MMSEYNKATLSDLKGKRDVEMEVNFSPELKEYVKITIGSEEATIAIKDLYSFVFLVGDEEQQANLLPERRTTIRKYVRQHRVKAKQTIHPGKEMVFNCEIDVPLTVEEGLRGILDKPRSPILRA